MLCGGIFIKRCGVVMGRNPKYRYDGGLRKGSYTKKDQGYCQKCSEEIYTKDMKPKMVKDMWLLLCEECYEKHKDKGRKDFWLSQKDKEKY